MSCTSLVHLAACYEMDAMTRHSPANRILGITSRVTKVKQTPLPSLIGNRYHPDFASMKAHSAKSIKSIRLRLTPLSHDDNFILIRARCSHRSANLVACPQGFSYSIGALRPATFHPWPMRARSVLTRPTETCFAPYGSISQCVERYKRRPHRQRR